VQISMAKTIKRLKVLLIFFITQHPLIYNIPIYTNM